MTTIIVVVVVALVFFVAVCVVSLMVWTRESEMRTDSIKAIEENLEKLTQELSRETHEAGAEGQEVFPDGPDRDLKDIKRDLAYVESVMAEKASDKPVRNRNWDPFGWVRDTDFSPRRDDRNDGSGAKEPDEASGERLLREMGFREADDGERATGPGGQELETQGPEGTEEEPSKIMKLGLAAGTARAGLAKGTAKTEEDDTEDEEAKAAGEDSNEEVTEPETAADDGSGPGDTADDIFGVYGTDDEDGDETAFGDVDAEDDADRADDVENSESEEVSSYEEESVPEGELEELETEVERGSELPDEERTGDGAEVPYGEIDLDSIGELRIGGDIEHESKNTIGYDVGRSGKRYTTSELEALIKE